MRIPHFIPMLDNERRKREFTGFLLEIFIWAYIFIILGKIVVFSIIVPFIETLAYSTPVNEWASFFINWLDYDSRYFEFPWMWIMWLSIAGGCVGAIIGSKAKGFGAWLASISKIQVSNQDAWTKINRHWRFARIEGAMVLILTILAGWVITDISVMKIFQIDGLLGAGRLTLQLSCGIPLIGTEVGGYSIFQGIHSFFDSLVKFHNYAFPENRVPLFDISCEPSSWQYFGKAVSKLVESIYLAFIATVFSVPVAFFLAFFAARNLTRHSRAMRFAYIAVRSYMNITRSIEALIWAILFSVWIGIGPFAGALALMVHTIASLVKQYSESLESVETGPIEALQAAGASRTAIVWFAVVPQIILPYLAFTIYRWDINVRMATIVGLVGGGGIGSILFQEQMLARWTQVGSLAFLIFLVVWSMDFLSARVREAIQ